MKVVCDVGVTGTREGMTPAQHAAARDVFVHCPFGELRVLHHGDCVGADAQFAELARELGARIVCHPPNNPSMRAFFPSDEYREPLTYFARNRAIVQACHVLVAAPPTMVHMPRGGTWYTIDYARKVRRSVVLVLPDGTVETTRESTECES